jgi:hypothetical protein
LIRKWFAETVLSDEGLIEATTAGIRKSVSSARSRTGPVSLAGEAVLLEMCYSFRDDPPRLGIFSRFFEEFQRDTKAYYEEFFKSTFGGNSFPKYLLLAAEQFAHEEVILKELLRKPEQDLVLRTLHDVLLVMQEEQFLSGPDPPIAAALTVSDTRAVRWLVETYERFHTSPERIYTTCAEYVHDEMVKHAANFKDLKAAEIATRVGELITATNALSLPYERAFRGVAGAAAVLEDKIRLAWNRQEFDIVNSFCTYIDHQIKSEFKSFSPEDKQVFPQLVAKFYTRIEDKKMFSEFYVVGMTRRLIKMPRKLQDLEFPIISAIRRAKAPDFAKPWTEFMRAVKDSENLENAFRETYPKAASDSQHGKISFTPLLFDQRTFPLDKSELRRLPAPLDELHRFFEQQYEKQFPRKKLMLLSDVSVVECKFAVPKNAKSTQSKVYIVSSDVTCASILLAIAENQDGITLREITERVGDRNVVGQYLVRLCALTCPIIKRTAQEKKMNDDDIFQFNPQFFFSVAKVTVQPIASQRKVDLKNTAATVEMDKVQAIKAAAVRVLKMKNRVEQTQLENDVIQAVAAYFRADLTVIRREIVELENADYLEKELVGGQTILIYKQ